MRYPPSAQAAADILARELRALAGSSTARSHQKQHCMAATNQALSAGYQLLNYRIDRQISRGGFSIVYRAFDETGAPVAIKEYLPSSLAERSPGELTPRVKPEKQPLYRLGLKSFFEEGRSLAQISHASVVSVLNFFRENETVYMVMNYLEGATLQDFIITARELKKQKVFRESTIRSLFDEILRGLRIVHQHKMLHLDIKPANIFITDDNKAVMIDFGAAREVLSKEGNFIRPMYTPGFAAPEQYRDPDRLGEPLQEDGAEQRHQPQGDPQLLTVQERRDVRVLHQVRARVRGRERDGDDEVGSGKAEQHQNEDLALPERHQPLQHGDRTLAVRTLASHAAAYPSDAPTETFERV